MLEYTRLTLNIIPHKVWKINKSHIWKLNNGRDYILQEVEKIEVYNPGGRDIEVAHGYPIRLLDSCINHTHCKLPIKEMSCKNGFIFVAGTFTEEQLLKANYSGEIDMDFMRGMLKAHGGTIAYWDSDSLAIVCSKRHRADKILQFMERMSISYNPINGLILYSIF